MLQIHGFFLLFLAFLIILVVKIVRDRRDRAAVTGTCKFTAIAAGMFVVLNLYWLLPALTVKETLLQQISSSDIFIFAPKPTSDLGVMFDLSAMYGFWRGGYTYANETLSVWWVLFAFLFYLAVLGFVYKLRDGRIGLVVWAFGLIWGAGLLLAAGAAIDFTRPAFEWLFDHSLFFRGFRDSQKFVALICLSYSFLGGLGVYQLARSSFFYKLRRARLPRIGTAALVGLALVVPLVYCYPIFGFGGQLKPIDYPEAWYQVNDYLNEDDEDFNVLFLPWHMYMGYQWLPNRDKSLMNPAHRFFDKPVICGDNIEVGGIYSQSTNPISKYVEFLLKHKNQVDNFGELLAPLNVKYVVLVHEVDYKSYSFLYRQQDLAIEREVEKLTIFRNEHFTTRTYAVDSVVYVRHLEEYLELSSQQDVMQHLYVLGEGANDGNSTGVEQLETRKITPVKYEIEGSDKQWGIFTVPQRVSTDYWEYHGRGPEMKNLGLMPVFEVDEGGGKVTYSRFFHVYVAGYVISIMTLVILIAVYFSPAYRLKRSSKGTSR
ncbi:hypothetical protein ACFLXE_00495 [Chloroflexota bacterium]